MLAKTPSVPTLGVFYVGKKLNRSFMARLVCLFALLLMHTPASHAIDHPYLQELIAKARVQHLADDRQWHALMHYRENLLFRGVTGQADDPQFYLAEDGKTDPSAELDATLQSFFAPPLVETDAVQHPQCKFIARYHWLQRVLQFDPQRLPPQACGRFGAWRAELNASALTLVFPSAYINNPSSMFGHTLLRVDAANQDERTRLLAYAINYAVSPGSDGGTMFIIKSLVGAYPGTFSLSPYYVKVKEYSDMENRDIWEYRLNFTQAEIDMLLMHAWELGPVKFDYYFFDENCAYHLLSLFEVARPSLRLTEGFRGWVIPVDTVRRVTEESGMLAEVVYRPANNTRLRDRLAAMTSNERVAVQRMVRGEAPENVIQDIPAERQATLLEGAYALLRYEDRHGRLPHADAARQSRALLLARSRVVAEQDESAPPLPTVRPEYGHKTRRFTVGIGREDQRAFQTLEFRPAYNDLLDPSGGYTEGAQINFMDFSLRHDQASGRVALEKLSLVDIYSLAPRDAFFKPVSWKINVGIARERLSDTERAAVFRTNGGAGFAFGSWNGAVVYGLIEGTLDIGDKLEHSHALGLGPSIGLFMHPVEAWKLHLYAHMQNYQLGDKHREREVGLAQSVSFGRQHALRLSLSERNERGGETTIGVLSWHWYF